MKQKIISFGGPPRRAPDRAQAAAAVNKRRHRRRTGRHTLHYLLILLAASAIMAVLSLTVFFKIETISVTGTTKYAPQEIIATAGIQKGDNLFRISQRATLKKLQDKFPYVENVTLERTFPANLTLAVTQAKPLGAASTAAGYIMIGRDGKILETGVTALPENTTVVTGMYLASITVGRRMGEIVETGEVVFPKELQDPTPAAGEKPIKKTQAQRDKEDAQKRVASAEIEAENLDMLTKLADAVTATEFGNITLVDFSDQLNMMLVYDGRVIVELGSQADLTYKLKFAKSAIETYRKEGTPFQGILDATMAQTSGDLWATPCDVEQELSKRGLTMQAMQEAAAASSSEKLEESAAQPAKALPADSPLSGLYDAVPMPASSEKEPEQAAQSEPKAAASSSSKASSPEAAEPTSPLDGLYGVQPKEEAAQPPTD